MLFMYLGVVLSILKALEIPAFFATVSWLWILLPFILAVVWWEVVEPAFGLDRKEDDEQKKLELEKKMRASRNRSGTSK